MIRLIITGLLCGLIGALVGIGLARSLSLTQSVLYFSLLGTIFSSSVGWYIMKTLTSR